LRFKFLQVISQILNMPFVTTPTLKMYYEEQGAGPPLLVFGGTGGDLRRKPNIMDTVLGRQFHLISHDQRGLGQSEKPADGYNMRAYADDGAHLLDALGIEKAHVLGLSFGGMVAQHFALHHSQRLHKLALFCTAPGGAGGASYPLQDLLALDPERQLRERLKLNDTRLDDAWIDANPEFVETARVYSQNDAFDDDPHRVRGAMGQFAARASHDCWDRLGEIQCPVWLAGGKYDGIAKPAVMENMLDRLPHAELTFYDGGHLFMTEKPQSFDHAAAFFNRKED
jgi:3-oxoadipate enol-lactonase